MHAASHILVKHSGSRRLSSWRDSEGCVKFVCVVSCCAINVAQGGDEQAIQGGCCRNLDGLQGSVCTLQCVFSSLIAVLIRIVSGRKTFEEIAQVQSDCGSAAQGGGLLIRGHCCADSLLCFSPFPRMILAMQAALPILSSLRLI